MFTQQQNDFLARFAKTQDCKDLQGVLESYILALKDDCVFGPLAKEVAAAAIEKLRALQNKLSVLAGDKPAPERNKFT